MGKGKLREWFQSVGALIGMSNVDIRDVVRGLMDRVCAAIKAAQDWSGGEKTGAEKLDYAADWLAGEFNIPLASESRERAIAKFVITSVVELAISLWGDDKWFENLMGLVGLSDLLEDSSGEAPV